MSADLDTATPLLSRAKDFAVRTIAGETILVPIRSGVANLESIFLLNETGTVVWAALEQSASPALIVEAVISEFQVDHEKAEKDVAEYLSTLESAGLIQRRAETAG